MKNSQEKLKIYRILATKSVKDIRFYCDRIMDEIERSNDEKRFLNLGVWLNGIEKEVEVLNLVERLSIEEWRNLEKLD